MTYVVPYDGRKLSRAALERAVKFADELGHDVVTVTVVPRNDTHYAREKGWIPRDERFSRDAVREHIESDVRERAPDAEVRIETVDRYATTGTISTRLRRVIERYHPDLVFVGTGHAGSVISSLVSVGRSLAADEDYDVLIVRGHHGDRPVVAEG